MIKQSLSIVVPTYNEEHNIIPLVEKIAQTMQTHDIEYEILFIDDNSSDLTQHEIIALKDKYPVRGFRKRGKKGKATSLIEGFTQVKYPLVCMIDADLQYPPEAIPAMIDKINEGFDVVVADRVKHHTSKSRAVSSKVFRNVFGKRLHGLDVDVQSGLKIFKAEILRRFKLNPQPWTFDLEFLTKARNAGYQIGSVDILFAQRHSGKTKINGVSSAAQIMKSALAVKMAGHDPVSFTPEMEAQEGKGFHFKGKKFIHHTSLAHHESAITRFSRWQVVFILSMMALYIVLFSFNWHATVLLTVAVLTTLYFIDLLFNFNLIIRSFSKPTEVKIPDSEVAAITDAELPTYTIFCPLYKEWEVIPQFVTAMSRLEYPKEKLQVMLLLEEDDKETVAHARRMDLPSYFDIVVVPDSNPKTKPKACNYGLLKATGEYVVVYDAEDVPDPLQLKKAILAFKRQGTRTVCIQAKLNFYNPHQNILTRVFTAEYSLWFDLVLTGLQSINAPIPLGGTSNHFKTQVLKDLQGWDSFNVTEDCDLGMRIAKRGYKTAVVDSMTLEEANSDLKNWFWQRTRWIKGYIQTYFVHMRNPGEFIAHWQEPHVITFQIIVGGKILSMFINPIMWGITLSYFILRATVGPFIESFFPTPILYMGVFSLVIGNFLYVYYYMIGCAKREYYDIIKYAFLVPFYWLAMSAAAWVALYKFIKAPHHWSKTKHGLHLSNAKAVRQSEEAIGESLVDTNISKNPHTQITL